MIVVKAGFWLLSPNYEQVKAQRAPHNEFVESELNKLGLNESYNAHNGSEILRQQSKEILPRQSPRRMILEFSSFGLDTISSLVVTMCSLQKIFDPLPLEGFLHYIAHFRWSWLSICWYEECLKILSLGKLGLKLVYLKNFASHTHAFYSYLSIIEGFYAKRTINLN